MIAILHCDREWGIGRRNGLMFHLPLDMKFFRETTTGHVVVMGANTLRSLPGGRPLRDRVNVVLDPDAAPREDCTVVSGPAELLAEIGRHPPDEVFVIGGAMTYRTLLPYCDTVLVTKVDAVGGADAFFPDLDRMPEFVCEQVSEPQETGGFRIRFCRYRNLAPKPLSDL